MNAYEAVEGVLRACAEHWIVLGWLTLLARLLLRRAFFEVTFTPKKEVRQ